MSTPSAKTIYERYTLLSTTLKDLKGQDRLGWSNHNHSNDLRSLNNAAASLILENSMQNAWTSIKRSLTARLNH